jgi:hypothetical protein
MEVGVFLLCPYRRLLRWCTFNFIPYNHTGSEAHKALHLNDGLFNFTRYNDTQFWNRQRFLHLRRFFHLPASLTLVAGNLCREYLVQAMRGINSPHIARSLRRGCAESSIGKLVAVRTFLDVGLRWLAQYGAIIWREATYRFTSTKQCIAPRDILHLTPSFRIAAGNMRMLPTEATIRQNIIFS